MRSKVCRFQYIFAIEIRSCYSCLVLYLHACIYDILATFKLSCNISQIKSPAVTSALIILRYDIIYYMDIQHIFTQIFNKREVLRSQFTFYCSLQFTYNLVLGYNL